MTTANSQTDTALGLIQGALQEIGVLAGGETAALNDQAWGMKKLQRLIDTYNAKRTMIYANTFTSFPITPNLSPHTIGPTGTFGVSQRPVEIPSISVQLTDSTPGSEVPMYSMNADEWAAVRVKNVTSTFPTAYYYEPDWPNGSIYFWPVPTAANNVLLQQRTVVLQPTAFNATFTMPPGYWNLISYELAIELAPSFQAAVSQDLRERYQQAKLAVLSNNIKSPRGTTLDAGMPGGRNSGGFNWVTGQPA